jgi:hypothetical protein
MANRYKIVNTTIKEPRIHPKTGVDLRTKRDIVGHNVSFRLDTGERLEVERHRPRIVSHINEGMLNLQRGGYIKIEPVDDVTTMLKQHTLGSKKLDALAPEESVKSAEDGEKSRLAYAVQMGEDTYEQRSGKETEGAVNPDGDPNFVVRADKNMKRQKKLTKDDSEAEAPTA